MTNQDLIRRYEDARAADHARVDSAMPQPWVDDQTRRGVKVWEIYCGWMYDDCPGSRIFGRPLTYREAFEAIIAAHPGIPDVTKMTTLQLQSELIDRYLRQYDEMMEHAKAWTENRAEAYALLTTRPPEPNDQEQP